MAKAKFYVVWIGLQPGIYNSWAECEKQTKGYTGAAFMAFGDLQSAEQAYRSGFQKYFGKAKSNIKKQTIPSALCNGPDLNSICVDAACSGNPGIMEYKGVETGSGKELFRQGPFMDSTNNLGEFLAIVHGLAFLKKRNSGITVYSDSATAISWVKRKNVRSKLIQTDKNAKLFELINRALKWLKENECQNKVLKWQTDLWGEIPADFGRK